MGAWHFGDAEMIYFENLNLSLTPKEKENDMQITEGYNLSVDYLSIKLPNRKFVLHLLSRIQIRWLAVMSISWILFHFAADTISEIYLGYLKCAVTFD